MCELKFSIKKMLQDSPRPDIECRQVQLFDLKHAVCNEDPIVWSENELERHMTELEHLKSNKFLHEHPNLDVFEIAQKTRHHQLYVKLLKLLKSNVECFDLMHLDEHLGYYNANLQALAGIIGDIVKRLVSDRQHMIKFPIKKNQSQAFKGNGFVAVLC